MTPFVEGYIAALRKSLPADQHDAPLAGETLALIMEDCSHAANVFAGLGFKTGAVEGERFWRGRNNGSLTGVFGAAYPPQAPHLGEDGKVYLREPSQ